MSEHYWAGKVFRREGVLRRARRWKPPPQFTLGLAISLLLLISFAFAWKARVLESRRVEPRADIYVHDLFADSGGERGAESPRPFAPPPSAGYLLLVLHPPDSSDRFLHHDVELRERPRGTVRWRTRNPVPGDFGTLNVGLERSLLAEGSFELLLYGVESTERRVLLASFPLESHPARQRQAGDAAR